MREIIYYIMLAVIIMTAMFVTSIFMSEVVKYTGVGTKGIVAGVGIFIIYRRKTIFRYFDKMTGKKPDTTDQIDKQI